MPKVQEYLPQVGAPAPQGGLAPETEFAGAAGRGIEKFGSDLYQVGDQIQKRQAQVETSDSYAATSQQTADTTNAIRDGVANGNLDPDAINKQIDDFVNDNASHFGTPVGRAIFERQVARLKKTTTLQLGAAQARMAGDQEEAAASSGFQASQVTLSADPASFPDVVKQHDEFLQSKVLTGQLTAQQAETFAAQHHQILALTAIDATARTNPSLALEQVRHGVFDGALDLKGKQEALDRIDLWQRADNVQQEAAKKSQKDADDQKAKQFTNTYVNSVIKGTANTAQLVNAPLDGEKKLSLLNATFAEAKRRDDATNTPLFVQTMQRIVHPNPTDVPVRTDQEILDMVRPDGTGLSMPQAQKLITFWNKTPENKQLAQSRALVMNSAKQLLMSKDIVGLPAADAPAKMQSAIDLIHEAEADAVKNSDPNKPGNPVKDLYDPKSPNYIWPKIQALKSTPQASISDAAALNRAQAIQAANPNAPVISDANAAKEYLRKLHGGK